jgi:alcohol dehydrogenase class IV
MSELPVGPLSFLLPTRIELGVGLAERLGKLSAEAGYRSAFVVVDPGVHAAGAADGALRSLEAAGLTLTLWTRLQPNPTDVDVEAGAAALAEDRKDVIIGIGGGSALDTAKGIAVLATNPGRVRDFAGNGNVPNRAWPLVLVPTTAGTGSEVTANISITDVRTHDKLALRDPNNYATLAILDPALLRGLPAPAAAAAGMDALTHAVESYVSVRATALTKLLAYDATRRIGASIEAFVADRGDERHATEMLYASCLAGIAISHTGTGNAHAVARALGGRYGVAHGLGCGVALEPVMRFNSEAVRDDYATLAQALRVADPSAGADANAERAIRRVGQIRATVGLPERLDVDVAAEALPELGRWAADASGPNPRPTSPDEAAELVRAVVRA